MPALCARSMDEQPRVPSLTSPYRFQVAHPLAIPLQSTLLLLLVLNMQLISLSDSGKQHRIAPCSIPRLRILKMCDQLRTYF